MVFQTVALAFSASFGEIINDFIADEASNRLKGASDPLLEASNRLKGAPDPLIKPSIRPRKGSSTQRASGVHSLESAGARFFGDRAFQRPSIRNGLELDVEVDRRAARFHESIPGEVAGLLDRDAVFPRGQLHAACGDVAKRT